MMENIGLGMMLEMPCVVVDIQRGSPSTGLPTLPGQSDVMQARWGSHGDYGPVAFSPWSPQEAFDLTVHAFNVADRYRVPVFLLADEVVGHMVERVVIPASDDIEHWGRKRPANGPGPDFEPFRADPDDLVPPIVHAGEGYRLHYTSLTHDERGYPSMNLETQDKLVRRLQDKIRTAADRLALYEEEATEDADVVVVSYGITSRVSQRAIDMARARGFKVGRFRLKTVWPFPDAHIRRLAASAKAFVVPELNLGQISREVERAAAGAARTIAVTHAGGAVHRPEKIFEAIQEGAQ
jgi:2-oxoglutarate ferredoxin oxidoreductase subunit alpha